MLKLLIIFLPLSLLNFSASSLAADEVEVTQPPSHNGPSQSHEGHKRQRSFLRQMAQDSESDLAGKKDPKEKKNRIQVYTIIKTKPDTTKAEELK